MNSATGVLTAIAGTNSTGANPIQIAASPSGNYLYVANTGDGTISAFSINKTTGALTALSGSPFTGVSSNGYLAMDPAGDYLYAYASGVTAAIPISSSTGVLGTPVTTSGSGTAAGLTIHPNGKFLYTAASISSTFTITPYTIGASGALTAGTAVTAGSFSAGNLAGISIDPTGSVLYAPNVSGSSVYGFTINSTTGALTAATTTSISGAPFATAIDPSSKYLFVSTTTQIVAYSMNTSTAVLTQVTGSPYTVSNASLMLGITVDPTGGYVFAPNIGSSQNGTTLAAYSYSSSTGALTALNPTTYTTGTAPIFATVVKVQQ
jgi:6-phosphogluconolactonase (cycloisomerase 2 family)